VGPYSGNVFFTLTRFMTHSFLYEAANHPTYENYLTWGPPICLWVGLELISNHVERYILIPSNPSRAFFLHYVPSGCSLLIYPQRTFLDHCVVNRHCPSQLEMKWTNRVLINDIYMLLYFTILTSTTIAIYVLVFYHIDVYNYRYIFCCILSYWHFQLLLSTPHKSNNIKSP
jgi:hypothetical protein